MKNADKPANPVPEYPSRHDPGLSKREHFCLHAGVPATGDEELDAIIREGERRRIADRALSAILNGMIGGQYSILNEPKKGDASKFATMAVKFADKLSAELEKGEG